MYLATNLSAVKSELVSRTLRAGRQAEVKLERPTAGTNGHSLPPSNFC